MSTVADQPPAASQDHTSPSHPFANLDPALHQPALTLNSVSAGESSTGANPLNEFAQQVLGREDAENLLDFGRHGHSIGEEQSFGELLQAAGRRDEVGDGDADAPSRTEHDQQQLHDLEAQKQVLPEGLPAAYEHQSEGVEGDAAEQQGRSASGGIAQRLAKRKRAGEESVDGETQTIEPQEYARIKKDSHKEVERRRRENINDGINEIAQLIPGGLEKQGKGTLLKRAAQHMSELSEKVNRADEEVAKREQEKQDLRIELAHVQARLSEEHSRSLRYETSWREAEDRAASSQFELERVKAELEAAKALST